MIKKKNIIFLILITILLIVGSSVFSYVLSTDEKHALYFATNNLEKIFDYELSESSVEYDIDGKVYDMILHYNRGELQIWCQVNKNINEFKIICCCYPAKMRNNIVIPSNSNLKKAQIMALNHVRSRWFSNVNVIEKADYNEQTKIYSLSIRNYNGMISTLKVDMSNNDDKFYKIESDL